MLVQQLKRAHPCDSELGAVVHVQQLSQDGVGLSVRRCPVSRTASRTPAVLGALCIHFFLTPLVVPATPRRKRLAEAAPRFSLESPAVKNSQSR